MRLPLRLLPVAIRAATKVRKALFAAYEAACGVETDLTSMVEPQTVEDLCPARCFECQAPGSLYCDKCQVLNTGRVAS